MKSTKISLITKSITFIALAIILTLIAAHLLNFKEGKRDYKRFYEQPDDYEVLFYGASVVHYSYSPMKLWHDYGITSYNMGNDSEKLATTYYTILNSLDYASPKLIVVDLSALGWAGQRKNDNYLDHYFMDTVALSKHKLKEITDLYERDKYMEYIFPFMLFHSRWKELNEYEFNPQKGDFFYGVNFMSGFVPAIKPTIDDYELSRWGDVESEIENIDRIVNLCNERNINLLFTYFPSINDGGNQKLRDLASILASERNIPFLNMQDLECLDWNKDFIDDAHLNLYGAFKINDYIGEHIRSNYSLSDYRYIQLDEIDKEHFNKTWNSDYAEYTNFLDEWDSQFLDEYKIGNI